MCALDRDIRLRDSEDEESEDQGCGAWTDKIFRRAIPKEQEHLQESMKGNERLTELVLSCRACCSGAGDGRGSNLHQRRYGRCLLSDLVTT
ncbi:hypothetical protein EYF80_029054 [Liparis tanakae]|uniref:Uncharacterized protein n=1 Tax=Liparis tanakae TaxID=230148 RepID=A0A4Z2H5E6_9TELE|nr:hypothetical protein EYF80_029054 [Liparis tanakae]